MNKITTLAFIILCIPFTMRAQAKDTDTHINTIQRFNVSYVFGGQVYNDIFIYNPGIAVDMAYGVKVSKDVAIGFGTGYMSLMNENFVPIFFESTGYHKRKGRERYMKFQGGYSLAWNDKQYAEENYDLNNGLFFDFGVGRKWQASEQLYLTLQVSYRHQFASMEYKIFGGQNFSDELNFDMLVLSIGILNNKR